MVLKRPVGFCYFTIFLSVCLRHSQVLTQRNQFSLRQPSLVQTNSTISSDEAWAQPSLARGNGTALTTYAWSAWGSWSPCSRSCGGGVSVQERQCLPRDPSRLRRSRKRRKMLPRPLPDSIRKARSTPAAHLGAVGVPDCPGLARRYHECNTAPCPGLARDSRADQCAVYDRRPFRGRFYTWVPYVDGNSPCTLNCRPRGQQFYASLALVADGTPCTKPGFRAICVQGNCLAVGREGVLSSTAMQDVQCGSKMVSGLFTRQKLPLGYTFVTTIPMGACRLNITESQPSANYIVLKVTNGSFIINGDFALSAPGTYDALGARFIYSINEKLASVLAAGPIHHPVDVMMLYTAGKTNLRYEYLAESEKSHIRKSVTDNTINNNIYDVNYQPHPPLRHHRHQNAEYSKALERMNNRDVATSKQSTESNTRNFVWKILSYTPCSRTCGAGLQIGKYKCVEVTNGKDREVSPAYCKDSAPAPRRRRCGGAPCPARWRAAVWGPCPVCGPANRTRTVGCVRTHARGITKISDDKCSLPKPPSTEPCNIPACDAPPVSTSPRPDHRRQVRPVDRTDNFRNGPVYTLKASPTENEISPTLSPSFSFSAAGGWLYTEWSECVGWCEEGVRSRGVRCADPSGCSPHRAPVATQPCKPAHCDAQWFTSEWSPCSAPCGGRQIRGVVCMGGNNKRRDIACRLPKPETERACGGTCSPSWYLSDWGECKGPCEAGVQTRTVWCARGGVEGASGAARDTECPGTRPLARKSCVPARCTTRPLVAPTVIRPPVSDSQPRVQRQESNSISPQISNTIDKPVSDGRCTDQLSHCGLAVQARLCHYPYYSQYCCHSCHGR